jgi:transcriptional regulator with XRE-family HTH domain
LALESGIDRTFVSMLERGVRQPALSTVFALSEVLSVSPGALIDRTAVMFKTAKSKR